MGQNGFEQATAGDSDVVLSPKGVDSSYLLAGDEALGSDRPLHAVEVVAQHLDVIADVVQSLRGRTDPCEPYLARLGSRLGDREDVAEGELGIEVGHRFQVFGDVGLGTTLTYMKVTWQSDFT